VEHIKDIVIALIVSATILGLFFTLKGCHEDKNKSRMECLKLGKTVDECNRAFFN
jgi:hypothetical protein